MINFYVNSITYLIELSITLTILLNGFKVRKNLGKTLLWGLLLFSASFCVYFFIGMPIFNIIATFIVIFALSLLGFDTSIKESIVNSVSISTIELISEFVCMAMFSSVGDMELLETDLNYFIVWTVASKIIYLFLGLILIRISKRLKNKRIKQKSSSPIYLFLYPLCTVFALYVYWIVLANNTVSQMTKIYISASVVSLIVAVIATCAFYAYTEGKNIEVNSLQSELDKIQIEKEYYALLEYQSEHIKSMAHDEKNHLLAIKGMTNKDEINKYIDKIYDELQIYSSTVLSDNKQLNVLLNKYRIECEAKGIKFKTNIGVADFSKLSDTDLVSLMSNVLDNAVEAAEKSSAKLVHLSINKTMGADALVCANSCDDPPKTKDNKLITTKQGKNNHGYGTKIIEDIVNKYSGTYSWHYEAENKEFTITIAL